MVDKFTCFFYCAVGAPVMAMTGTRSAYEPAMPLTALSSPTPNVVTIAPNPLMRA